MPALIVFAIYHQQCYCTLPKDQLVIIYFLILHLTHIIVEHAFYYGMMSNAHCRVYGTTLLSTEIVIIHYNDYHLEGHINEVHRQTVFLYSTLFQPPDHSQGIAIFFDCVDCLFLSTRVRRSHSLSTLCCLTFGFYFMLQVITNHLLLGYGIGSCFVWLRGEGCALFSACFYKCLWKPVLRIYCVGYYSLVFTALIASKMLSIVGKQERPWCIIQALVTIANRLVAYTNKNCSECIRTYNYRLQQLPVV